MSKRLRRWTIKHHLSVADERFGLRLGAGLVVTPVAAVVFVPLLLLVRAGWPPLRDLDAGTAEALNRIGTDYPELVKSAEVVSDVFDPNVFRVALTLIALVYLIRGERHHATWLVVTVFGGAALGFALATWVFHSMTSEGFGGIARDVRWLLVAAAGLLALMWVHFQRHYSLAEQVAYRRTRTHKEFRKFKEALRG